MSKHNLAVCRNQIFTSIETRYRMATNKTISSRHLSPTKPVIAPLMYKYFDLQSKDLIQI